MSEEKMQQCREMTEILWWIIDNNKVIIEDNKKEIIELKDVIKDLKEKDVLESLDGRTFQCVKCRSSDCPGCYVGWQTIDGESPYG